MSTTTPRRALPWLLQAPHIADVHPPRWFERLPRWASTGGVLLVLLAISAFLRSRYLSGQLWSEEAIATGIASHSLSAIPGLLRIDGSAPLYFLLLHFWIGLFGSTESASHGLSLVLGLISVPVAMWTAWSLWGRRAGMLAGVLFAFSAFLTQYASETQVYELVAVLGLLATASFLHAFVYRRRGYVVWFAIAVTLLLYTSIWAAFFWVGAAAALIPIYLASSDRSGVLRDATLAFAGALAVFGPWVPTLAYQLGHDTSPWGFSEFIGPTFPTGLLGGDRVFATFGIVVAAGLLPLLSVDRRRTREASAIWALLALPVVAMLFAGACAIFAPAWVTRYFAPLLAPMLLLTAFTAARTGILGLVAVFVSLAFVANPASFNAKYKSDMRDVAGELAPLLRPGDTVLVAEPEQAPLAWYYLPAGLHFATVTGPLRDPSVMNWSGAYRRLAGADPRRTLSALVAGLRPGSRLLVARPLSEGAEGWRPAWAALVRRRAAQWGALLARDPLLKPLPGAVAPHNYRGSCCTAVSAIVYTRVG